MPIPVRRVGAPALILSLTVLTACGDGATEGTESQGSTSPATTNATQGTATADTGAGAANTAEVVAAAEAFLATLSDEQRDTVLYDVDDAVEWTGWSNFPVQIVERNGIALGDLTDEQEAAALAVMQAALSDQGYEQLVGIRKSDAYLSQQAASGGNVRGGGMPVSFGEDPYYLAFFGEPSETEQFTVQFGGHHAAYNIT